MKKTEMIFCACGCGNKRLKYDKKGRVREYINYHHWVGKKHSEEAKKKITKYLTGKTYEDRFGYDEAQRVKAERSKRFSGKGGPFYGRKHSEESKRIIGESSSKRTHIVSEETKRKISIANTGKTRSKESIEKVVKHLRGKTYEEIMGSKEKAEARRKKRSEQQKEIRKTFTFPKNDTKIEIKIQEYLTKLHLEFYTHKYMKIEHGYQCDILIPVQKGITQKIIIECDGCYWHSCPICKKKGYEGMSYKHDIDKFRTEELEEQGFRVIRLWEHEINKMELNDLKKKVL